MERKLIVLDPGHGGHDPGAVNHTLDIKEAGCALDVCIRAMELIKPFADVKLTRESDIFLPLSQRPALANKWGADAFVSYHFNSAKRMDIPLSYEGYTTRGQNRSDHLCTAILEAHGQLFPEQRLREDGSDGDLDKEANFAVLRPTDCPSCLIEGEFIHTYHGGKFIKDPFNRQNMALAVATGTLNFLEVPHTLSVPGQNALPAVGEGDMPEPPAASTGGDSVNLTRARQIAAELLNLLS